MVRTLALSIVLTLAVGPNTALLCRVWCHPSTTGSGASHHGMPAAAPSTHHHGEPVASSAAGYRNAAVSSVMTGGNTCPDCGKAGFGAVQFLREDGRRSVSALDSLQTILVHRYQFAPSTIPSRPQHEPWRQWSLEERQLPTVLRV